MVLQDDLIKATHEEEKTLNNKAIIFISSNHPRTRHPRDMLDQVQNKKERNLVLLQQKESAGTDGRYSTTLPTEERDPIMLGFLISPGQGRRKQEHV